MYDNKVRLSRDVLEKAEQIAAEWGLKNARAAVEAVFRRYCDTYHGGAVEIRPEGFSQPPFRASFQPVARAASTTASSCEALEALDELLAL